MTRLLLAFSPPMALAAMVLLAACGGPRTYEARGRVVGFGDDARTVIISHEDIPGLMPAMTMPFRLLDPDAGRDLTVGQAIAFRLHMTPDSSWITDVSPLADSLVSIPRDTSEPVPNATGMPVLSVGDAVPAFALTTAEEARLNTADLAGKAWVVSFIYTRCPLPDYCPLLASRFQQLQAPLQERYGDRVRLLSVSIDPEYDTPAVLRDYAARYAARPETWTFATGDPDEIRRMAQAFGVYYEATGEEVVHNLVTALVGPDGRLKAVWRGNDWTVEELLAADAGL